MTSLETRVLHALCAHGHAVGDGRRTKNLGIATSLLNACNGCVRELLQTTVTWGDGAVTIGHTNHGLGKIALLVTHRVIHGAIGGSGFSLGDLGGAAIDLKFFSVHGVSKVGALGRKREANAP